MQTSDTKKRGMSVTVKIIILFLIAALLALFIWKFFDYRIEKLKSGTGYQPAQTTIHKS